MPNFVKIGQSVANILRFFDFSRWRQSAILDLFGAYLQICPKQMQDGGLAPAVSIWGSLTLQNLVMIDAVVFII